MIGIILSTLLVIFGIVLLVSITKYKNKAYIPSILAGLVVVLLLIVKIINRDITLTILYLAQIPCWIYNIYTTLKWRKQNG